jgi:hypothetical protein
LTISIFYGQQYYRTTLFSRRASAYITLAFIHLIASITTCLKILDGLQTLKQQQAAVLSSLFSFVGRLGRNKQ